MTNTAMIIGGGIAGPVTAMALRQAGIQAEVYEAYGQGSDGVGSFLTIAANGLAALRVLDLEGLVAGLGMDTPRMEISNSKGKHLGTLSQPSRTLRRDDLYRTLRDEAVARGVRIHYGKRLTDATMTADGVRATFADGATARADLLIGADGLRSRTRELIDPAAPKARHVGLLNIGGFAENVRVPGRTGTNYFIFGKRCFYGYNIHPDGQVWWFANPPSPKEPSADQLKAIDWRATLNELFRDDGGPMLDLIAATPHLASGWNTYDFPTVPKWSNDRMIIIGDAAHAASPSSGQGASMAIEDAVVLAKCLRDLPVVTAFSTYEKERRERVERIVKQGRRNGSGKAPGAVGAYLRDLVMPLVMRQIDKGTGQNWIYEYRIDWADRTMAG